MPSPNPNVPVLSNGASSTNLEGEKQTNGVDISSATAANGITNGKERSDSPRVSIEEGKEKAKAVMAASNASAQQSTDTPSTDKPGTPNANGSQTNGPSQTRKRSRDGELIHSRPTSPVPETKPRTKEALQQILLEQYATRELAHEYAQVFDDEMRCQTTDWLNHQEREYGKYYREYRAQEPGFFFGAGWLGYGNGIQDTGGRGAKIIIPAVRKRPANRQSDELYIAKKDREMQAEQIDELVPIRLDIEYDKFRIRDVFTWNLHDRTVPIELFARHLVEDFGIPPKQFEGLVHEVSKSIHEQIVDHHPHVYMEEQPLDPHLPYSAYKNDDMRITINLNITIGQHTLVDKFEWEINSPLNSPEEFAKQMTRDLSLTGEFTTAIAHSIREQAQLFTKSLYVTGHPFDGRPIEDHELQSAFCQTPIPSTFRPFQTAKDYTPYLYELNEAELEKTELSLSREERRQKRSVNRRGGPALPDLKDRRRTNRTLLVSTVLPSAVEKVEDSRLLKRTQPLNKSRRSGVRDNDESDDSDSDDSMPASPAIPLTGGTARTRGLRGAASMAQAAMRGNYNRSATPESVASHIAESRNPSRRVIRDDSSPEPQTSLIVKLKISRAKLQSFLRNQRARTKEMSQTPGPHPHSQNSTPGPGSMARPTSTPLMGSVEQSNGATREKGTPSKIGGPSTPKQPPTSKHGSTSSLGRVEATGPPGPEHPIPPPPKYLIDALSVLQGKYPNDMFEGTMRYTAVSRDTDEPFTLRPDQPAPSNTKYFFYPRIKCKDCPGKLYTPDVTLGVNNFEVHLKNRAHRERVQERLDAQKKKDSDAASPS